MALVVLQACHRPGRAPARNAACRRRCAEGKWMRQQPPIRPLTHPHATAAATAGLTLPYPHDKFAVEFTFQWLFILVDPVRIFLGERAAGAPSSGARLPCHL